MALTRQQKEAQVASAQADLTGATSVVFMTYDKLGVEDTEELRDLLHTSGAALRVMPKRLLRLVLKQLGWDFDPSAQAGQFAVIWGNDAVAPAKALHTFAKKRETVQMVAGALEGKMLSLAQVQALALLPSREELLAKLVGTLVNPIRGLQTVLSGVQRETVQVLQAIADQKSASTADPLK